MRLLLITALIVFLQRDMLRAQAPQLVAELATETRTYQIAWSPDGELIAVANENGALILDENLATVTNLRGHNENKTVSVAWRPDGSQLATGGSETNSTVRIWDRDIITNSFSFNRTLEAGGEATPLLVWSPDGQKLASLSMQPVLSGLVGHLNIWGTTGNWEPQPKPEYVYIEPLFELTWSFDSQYLALAARLGCTPLVTSGTCSEASHQGIAVINSSNGGIAYIIDTLFPPFGLTSSPVELKLAATFTGAVEIYDGAFGTRIGSLPGLGGRLAWSPDGTRLAGIWDDRVDILDLSSGEITSSVSFPEAWSIRWSPDGSKLAVANLDGLIQIWDVRATALSVATPTLTETPTPTPTPSKTTSQVRPW